MLPGFKLAKATFSPHPRQTKYAIWRHCSRFPTRLGVPWLQVDQPLTRIRGKRHGSERIDQTGQLIARLDVKIPGNHDKDADIFSLAIPAALALAADPLLQVVDTAFVGHAGPDALAALGINSALFTFSFLVFNFLGTATTPMVARARSSRNDAKAGLVTLQALTVASVSGGLLALLLLSCSDQALIAMGADPNQNPITYELAKEFLYIRALAAPAVMLNTVGQGVFGGLQDMKTPLGITASCNMINFSLDLLLIVGLGWGVRGAATATTAAEWIAA